MQKRTLYTCSNGTVLFVKRLINASNKGLYILDKRNLSKISQNCNKGFRNKSWT